MVPHVTLNRDEMSLHCILYVRRRRKLLFQSKGFQNSIYRYSDQMQHVADPGQSHSSTHAHALPVRDASWQTSSPLSASPALLHLNLIPASDYGSTPSIALTLMLSHLSCAKSPASTGGDGSWKSTTLPA